METVLSKSQFEAISGLVYNVAGIRLQDGKENLVRTRLAKRVQTAGCVDFDDYLQFLAADGSGQEAAVMIDLLTTNKTSFFRESQHFDYLRDVVFPPLAASGRAPTIWSAGCSSGEEPYTLAMLVREHLPYQADGTRILATDISERVLARARAGQYSAEVMAEVPAPLKQKHFTRLAGAQQGWSAGPTLRSLIRFARLNLMDAWPMKGPFDVIMCRNVMIYFDRQTQERLVNRYWTLLAPGGHLFVGHSESLTALNHRFAYVQPAVYRKPAA